MQTVKRNLSELKTPKKNVRIHSDKQIKEFCRSVKMFGQIRPLVIDEDDVILAGNGLREAMVALGYTEGDCYVVSGLSENQKKKLMLADNRIFNLGVDDTRAFEEIVIELGNDIDIPGYDSDILKTLTLDFDGIDAVMDGYGIISDSTKASMQKAAEQYEEEEESFVNSSQEIAVRPAPGTESADDALATKYIVCPKCGEKIWL